MINSLLIIIHTCMDWYCYYNNRDKASELLFINILDHKLEDIKHIGLRMISSWNISLYSYDFIINYKRAMNHKTWYSYYLLILTRSLVTIWMCIHINERFYIKLFFHTVWSLKKILNLITVNLKSVFQFSEKNV